MTKKPYYKLVIGGKSKDMTSADLRFDCGRVRIAVNDAYPDAAAVLSKLFDRHWRVVLNNVHAFIEAHPYDCALTEPEDRPLAAEVATINAAYDAREARGAQ